MRHYELSIRPFRQVACNKEQALKPLEEAAEIYGAWQELIIHDGATPDADARRAMLRDYVKQAVVNGHRKTMRELDVWEKNIAKTVEQRIKEAEGL